MVASSLYESLLLQSQPDNTLYRRTLVTLGSYYLPDRSPNHFPIPFASHLYLTYTYKGETARLNNPFIGALLLQVGV